MRTRTRAVRSAGLLLAATGLLGLTGATAAHASDMGGGAGGAQQGQQPNFILCSNGSYSSYAVFPKRNSATHEVPRGGCTYLTLTGISNDQVVLYGIGPNGTFKIATDTFDDADGEHIRTLGTPDDNDWTTF
ncbi:hypothetical protein ABTZ03_36415 [Kitasatospora sp. NPDC096077]|uniref:hypothetical protein n=1 Tax=Kitasatospora sp. NPDC096077 TaxID=3155544 RepID=UPI0033240644